MLWKSRFRVETMKFLRFFRAAYLRRGPRTTFADQGPSKTVAFFRTPSKIFMSGTWNFRIIEKNIKAIFREYFSSLREDSGKIFKLMTFRRGPRTTYWSWKRVPFPSSKGLGMLVNTSWQNGDRKDGKRLSYFSCILFLLAGHRSLT